MTTATFKPAANADDGYVSGATLIATNQYNSMGKDLHAFYRFPAVSIPNGATISSAKITFQAYSSLSGTTCNLNCFFNDSDDAVAPVTAAEFAALALTAAAAWNNLAATTANSDFDTPELGSILQAVVNRAGWAAGNAVMAVLKDNGSSADAYRNSKGYDNSATLCARLIVEYRIAETFEVDAAAEAGVNAAMDALHLVDDLAPEAGTKAEFLGFKMGDTLSAAAGSNAIFQTGGSDYSQGAAADAGVQTEMTGLRLADDLAENSGLQASFSRTFETARSMAAQAGVLADFDGFNWSDFLRVYCDRIAIRYTLTLSDGVLDDIIIPISSFQGRFRTGDPTYLSVVVPGNDQYADIAARDEGALILTMQYLVDGVVYHAENICTVDLEDIRIDEGASSVSVSLSGHRTVTHAAKTTQLTGAAYKAVYDGKIRYRCTPELYLRPGDTVTVGDDTFTAGMISWTVDPSQQTMEVEEA